MYQAKTALRAESYLKDGLTTVKLGSDEYVKLREVIGTSASLKYYARMAQPGTVVKVLVNKTSAPAYYIKTSEIGWVTDLRRINQVRWTKGVAAQNAPQKAAVKAYYRIQELLKPEPEERSVEDFLKSKGFGAEEPVVVNGVEIFTNPEFGSLRTITTDNGEIRWVGKDVADILGYSNSRDALAKHVDEEDKNTVANRDGIQGNPNMTVINESGLYSLILSSKLPKAKEFKRWITTEVLPSIRKHGAYIQTEQPKVETDNTDELIAALKKQVEIQGRVVELLEAKLKK